MLSDDKKACLKMLVAMAWADGRVEAEEMEVVEAMIDGFGAEPQEAEELRAWAKVPRSFDDVDTSVLTKSDAELVLQQAVLLTFIDGEQSPRELELLDTLRMKVGLDKDAAAPILERATAFAHELLPVLKA
jgi:tellurite resistance protein